MALHGHLTSLCSSVLLQLEKYKSDGSLTVNDQSAAQQRISEAHSASISPTSRQRYPQPSLESLLSAPSLPTVIPKASLSNAPAHASSDSQQLQLHIAALELQVATLREALVEAQDRSSLFEKQCEWFKTKELELQLSHERNRTASDLDYLRRLVKPSVCVR
jgi:hypothetical protein